MKDKSPLVEYDYDCHGVILREEALPISIFMEKIGAHSPLIIDIQIRMGNLMKCLSPDGEELIYTHE